MPSIATRTICGPTYISDAPIARHASAAANRRRWPRVRSHSARVFLVAVALGLVDDVAVVADIQAPTLDPRRTRGARGAARQSKSSGLSNELERPDEMQKPARGDERADESYP